MSIRKLYGQNYDYIGNIHGDTPGPLPGCGMALIFLHRKGLILLDQTQLAEQLAACAVRGVPPTARLRRLLRRMWRQALFCAPAPGVCCDISHCAAQLCLLLAQLCPQPGQCMAFTGPGAGLCAAAAPGELGCFLLWLAGRLMPPTPGPGLQMRTYEAGRFAGIAVFSPCPAAKKPPRSLCRSARRWAADRGGQMLFMISRSGLCAVLLLPKGPAAALRPPRYALWAYDPCSPPFSLLPLRLILPD